MSVWLSNNRLYIRVPDWLRGLLIDMAQQIHRHVVEHREILRQSFVQKRAAVCVHTYVCVCVCVRVYVCACLLEFQCEWFVICT